MPLDSSPGTTRPTHHDQGPRVLSGEQPGEPAHSERQPPPPGPDWRELLGRARGEARRRIRQRPIVAGAAALSALVLTGSGLAYAAVDHYTAKITPVVAFAGLEGRPADDGATNILLVGSDDRSGISEERRLQLSLGLDDFGQQTDTILLVHLSSGGSVDVLTIPRDSQVEIPAHADAEGNRVPSETGKINGTYSAGGAPLLVETLEQNTGVRIDHYLEVDFEGFVDIVDALGGVEVCAAEPISDELAGLELPAGRSVVDGETGLAYARARYFDPMADYGRMERQQALLSAMAAKAASTSVALNPWRANSTVNAVLGSLRADPALDSDEVRRIGDLMRRTTPSQVAFHHMPIQAEEYLDWGGLSLVWDEQQTPALFESLRTDEALGSASTPEPQDTAPPAPPDSVMDPQLGVLVLNGDGMPGSAASAGGQLADAGIAIDGTANGDYTPVSEVRFGRGYETAAQELAAWLGISEVVADSTLESPLALVVGEDFTGVPGADGGASAGAVTDVPELMGRTADQDICS